MTDKPKVPDINEIRRKLREGFTLEDMKKSIDLLAAFLDLHVEQTGCKEGDCRVASSIHQVGQYLIELMEIAWPGSVQGELDHLTDTVLSMASVEDLQKSIERLPVPAEMKPRILAKAQEMVKARGGGDPGKSLVSRLEHAMKQAQGVGTERGDRPATPPQDPKAFMAPPSKLVH